MAICTCALLLFQHNAQMLLACNYSHIMLNIIDSSLGQFSDYFSWVHIWVSSSPHTAMKQTSIPEEVLGIYIKTTKGSCSPYTTSRKKINQKIDIIISTISTMFSTTLYINKSFLHCKTDSLLNPFFVCSIYVQAEKCLWSCNLLQVEVHTYMVR